MGNDTISSSSEGFNSVIGQFNAACQDYLTNLNTLEEIVGQVTSGDFVGTAADAFKNKYEEKKEVFNNLKNIIKRAQETMENAENKFNAASADAIAGMR